MNHARELTCRVQSQEDTLFRPIKISSVFANLRIGIGDRLRMRYRY